ncbi:MAG: PIN domain-containing protein [Deltaproteobacteria bacterium]|nr:PIN domain-containing protein [Deltaproteobacteria bacterium]
MIVVDTSVWSLAFRRRNWPKGVMPGVVQLLEKLTRDKQRVVVPGIVNQELLSGIKEPSQAEKIMGIMEGYPILLATQDHHIKAANISNVCRKAGVSAATVDCLIAAQCIMEKGILLTMDDDFSLMARHCTLRLYPIPID